MQLQLLVSSYVYRLIISFSIALFVATQFFVIGVVMAIWTVTQSVLWRKLS